MFVPEFPNYVIGLIEKVKAQSGYPLKISEHQVLEFDSELKIAGEGRDYHILKYLSRYREHLQHFVVNNCYKILRVWEVPAEERYVPAHDANQKLPENEHEELVLKMGLMGAESEKLSRFIYTGVVRQLTSFPVDIRVEREVADELEEHRGLQRKYLEQQVKDFVPVMDEKMLAVVPERIYRASTAMNISFAETAAELAGVNADSVFQRHSSRGLAEGLLQDLEEVKEAGLKGDRLVTGAWAGRLGLVGWYSWVEWRG